MRNVQLAENLGKHLGEVIIVVDMGKERLIVLLQAVQVHSMVVRAVEFTFLLLEHMVEHVRSLGCTVKIHFHIEVNRLQLLISQRHDLRTASEDVKVLPFIVDVHRPGRDSFFHKGDLPCPWLELPQVDAFLEGTQEIQ